MVDQNAQVERRVEAIARELHRIDCDQDARDRANEGLPPVTKWADPWDEHGGGIRQRQKLLRTASRIIAADPGTTDLANAREVLLAYDSKVDGLNAEIERLKAIAKDLHWIARRYADGRQSYATSLHNENTRALLTMGVPLNATGDGTLWARDSAGRAYDGLTDEEAAQGRQPDWKHDDKERRVEQQEALLKQMAEALLSADIDVEYKLTHSQTKIGRMNAASTKQKIDEALATYSAMAGEGAR